MKITEYPKTKTIDKSDVLLLDGENGTKQIDAKDAALEFNTLISDNKWVTHRNVYRGKNLGNTFTDEQKAHIADGTFEDMYVGDYWAINSIVWRIADINYWMKTGNAQLPNAEGMVQKNHLVIMPQNALYYSKMYNSLSNANNGYAGSDMVKNGMTEALNLVENIFGENNILKRWNTRTTSTVDSIPTGFAWFEVCMELMTEEMVYGSSFLKSDVTKNDIIPTIHAIDNKQLSLFQLNPMLIQINWIPYWLRDFVQDGVFAAVDSSFAGSATVVTNSLGVRPIFGIC